MQTNRATRGAIETCANCGASIGNLETPFLWDNAIVCGPCHAKLSAPHFVGPDQAFDSLEDLAKAAKRPTQHIPYATSPSPESLKQFISTQKRRKWWLFPSLMAGWTALIIGLFIALAMLSAVAVATPDPTPKTYPEVADQIDKNNWEQQHPNETQTANALGFAMPVFGGGICLAITWLIGMLALGIMWSITASRQS